MSVPSKPASVFGEQLARELGRHPEIKSLRRLGRAINPERPEIGRRMLSKWVAGPTKPTLASRQLVATALGVDASAFEDDDDEEADELAYLLSLPVGDLLHALNAAVRGRSLSESGAGAHGTDVAPGSESEAVA